MNRKNWYEIKVQGIEISEYFKRNWRKLLSVTLLILIILGNVLMIGLNVYVFLSLLELRINPKDFNSDTEVDGNAVYSGVIEIDNDHMLSVDIRDVVINLSVSSDNGIDLFETSIEEALIPKGAITELIIEIEYDMTEIMLDVLDLEDLGIEDITSLEDLETLNETQLQDLNQSYTDLYEDFSEIEYLIFDMSISLIYWIYEISFGFEFTQELE